MTQNLGQYILYFVTWLISMMDLLKYIFKSPHVFGRVSKWQVVHSKYDVKYMTQKLVQRSVIVDHLAANLFNEYQRIFVS